PSAPPAALRAVVNFGFAYTVLWV
ncbi:MAG: hypothetical protein RL572_1693, partial [Pseudomonadota bacterium]